MPEDMLDALSTWADECVRRDARQVCLVPGEPAIYRLRSGLLRDGGEILVAGDLERLAEALLGPQRVAQLGRESGYLDARVRLPDGSYVSVTAARAGGEISLIARPVRTLHCDHRQIGVPTPVIRALEAQRGLLIVTGPAGCGKTTTCYALLEHLNATRPVHIITVGYHLDFVLEPQQALVQERQIGVDAPDMISGIQSAVLQGADVLFVGEIRDLEVFQACLRTAETGCLVLTQLHQPTPQAALERMLSLYPEEVRSAVRASLANVLCGVVAQRLLCTPSGDHAAAYGVLIPDALVRDSIRRGDPIPGEACDPQLVADIRRLSDAGQVVQEEAERLLESLVLD
jgi:twitching motility protein PilT